MMDQQDKMTQHPPEDIALSDASATAGQLIIDINDLSNQIRAMKTGVTPQYVAGLTREMLATKRAEFDTLVRLHTSKMVELSKLTLAQTTKSQIREVEAEIESNRKQVTQMFDTSVYAIADAKKQAVVRISTELKTLRAAITADFLHTASIKTLEEMRSKISELQSHFKTEYDQVHAENLENTDILELVRAKEDVESATPSVDRIIQTEINTKLKAQSPPDSAQPGEGTSGDTQKNQPVDNASLTQGRTEQLEQLEALRKQLNELISTGERDKRTAAETIKSLEQKLLHTYQNDGESSIELFEEDPMVGNAPGTDEPILEQAVTSLKVGSVNMPTFSGSLEEWEAFRDLFEHLIHNSRKISNTVKFYQLRTHLKGAALDTIRGYQVTGTNYAAAWADLKKRYNRTDELIEEYIRRFFESKPVEHKPNFVVLRKIIDSTNQMLRALPNLGATVTNWDPIVNLIISSKLNEELRSEWAEKRERDNVKGTSDYLNFLERKAIELQPKQGERLSQMLKGDYRGKLQQRKVFQITEKKTEPNSKAAAKKECLICKGNHHTWDCNMLKKESAKARTSIVKALGLCFKCLLKHRVGMCDNEDCEYCGGTHHIMLCYKKENEDKLRPVKSRGQNQLRAGPPGGPKPGPSRQPDDWDDWNNSAVQKN